MSLMAAMHAVTEDGVPCNSPSMTYNIPETTLRRYIKKYRNNIELPSHGGRFKETFSEKEQTEFVDYLKDLNDRAFGLTLTDCRKLAYEYATQNKISHRFNNDTKLAGKDWAYSFMKKHKISLRTPESTSLGRLIGFNKNAVDSFFTLLRDVKKKHKFTADRIYNVDESGLSTVTLKLPMVMSPTGSRRVAKVASGERGRNTTVVCGMNAQGTCTAISNIWSCKNET